MLCIHSTFCELEKFLLKMQQIGLSVVLGAGFAQVLENLESAGILCWHFPGLESPGKKPLVLESSARNLVNSTRRSKCQLSNLFTCMHMMANSHYQPS